MLGGGALIGGYNSQLEYTGDYGNYAGAREHVPGRRYLELGQGEPPVKFGGNFIRRQVNLFRPKAGKGYFFLWGNGSGQDRPDTKRPTSWQVSSNNYQIGAQTGLFGTRTWENGVFVAG